LQKLHPLILYWITLYGQWKCYLIVGCLKIITGLLFDLEQQINCISGLLSIFTLNYFIQTPKPLFKNGFKKIQEKQNLGYGTSKLCIRFVNKHYKMKNFSPVSVIQTYLSYIKPVITPVVIYILCPTISLDLMVCLCLVDVTDAVRTTGR